MYRTITLPNGAKILTEYMPGIRTAALGFFMGVGSRHERFCENGAAHLIEHMAFKGTTHRSASQLAQETDTIGGQLNAFTTKEYTNFHVRCLDSHLDRAIDLLCDMVFYSRFDQADLEVERKVVLEEIGQYEDLPDDLVSERLAAAVFQGSPLARPILGRSATLNRMTGEWLRQFHAAHYLPRNLVVSLCGSFTPAAVEMLKERIGQLEGGMPGNVKSASYCTAVTARRKAIEQNHLALAFPALSYLDSRRYQLLLLNSILGGGVSSRLFQEMRERRGLCYSAYSYVDDHSDTGLLGIYTAVNSELEREALQTVCRVVRDLVAHGPNPDELERAREQAKANVLMGLESPQARMSHMGTSALLYGEVLERDDILAAYDAITGDQVHRLAQETFDFRQIALSAVGRGGDAEEYEELLRQVVQETI